MIGSVSKSIFQQTKISDDKTQYIIAIYLPIYPYVSDRQVISMSFAKRFFTLANAIDLPEWQNKLNEFLVNV